VNATGAGRQGRHGTRKESTVVYKFRSGFHMTGDPQKVGAALETLWNGNGGHLAPEDVVVEAAKRRSVLHPYFEWDDTEAARQYRLSQAGYLIRAIVVSPAESEPPFEPVRAFVSVGGPDDEQARSFTHIREAMRDEELRGQVLQRARAELVAWRKRYADLQAFAEVFAAVDSLL
jgi:hypothetical protein